MERLPFPGESRRSQSLEEYGTGELSTRGLNYRFGDPAFEAASNRMRKAGRVISGEGTTSLICGAVDALE
jgi:hypothetical protein